MSAVVPVSLDASQKGPGKCPGFSFWGFFSTPRPPTLLSGHRSLLRSCPVGAIVVVQLSMQKGGFRRQEASQYPSIGTERSDMVKGRWSRIDMKAAAIEMRMGRFLPIGAAWPSLGAAAPA